MAVLLADFLLGGRPRQSQQIKIPTKSTADTVFETDNTPPPKPTNTSPIEENGRRLVFERNIKVLQWKSAERNSFDNSDLAARRGDCKLCRAQSTEIDSAKTPYAPSVDRNSIDTLNAIVAAIPDQVTLSCVENIVRGPR